MTDKQIINVSDCIYHNNCKCTNSEIGQCNCANVVSCYYKEYKRKEQECEELDNEAQNLFTEKTNLGIELTQLKAENEQLQEERNTLSVTRNKLLDDLWIAEENLKDYIEHFNKASDERDLLKIDRDSYIDKYFIESQKVLSLRKVLKEIKGIATHCLKQDICTTCDNSDRCHIEDEEIPTYDVCKLILQRIKEVEDVENN